MGTVDPADDTAERWVARPYGDDPDEQERWHRVLDNPAEFQALLDRLQQDPAGREQARRADRTERVSGTHPAPSRDRRVRQLMEDRWRLVRRQRS